MVRAKRVRRANEQELYSSCQRGGYCPDDIKNKVENNTLADKLLRAFSSILFLGGLGIGTGRGTGGASGYRPLQPSGAGSRIPDPVTIRPNIPVEGGIPVEAVPGLVEPGSSAIVPMLEAVPDTAVVIDSSAVAPTDSITVVHEVDNPAFDPSLTRGHPSVSTSEGEVAILDVTPLMPSSTRVALRVTPPEAPQVHVVEAMVHAEPTNVFVDPSSSGDTVGLFEDIELHPLNSSTFEIEDIPRSSTPTGPIRRTAQNIRRLYNRLVSQVPTRNVDFLRDPSRAVQFQFENEAFDPDITLQFEQDVAAVAAAPDPDFRDVRVLRRPMYSETPEGTIRVSRFGQRGHMHTRSGTLVGENVHFYYDLSPIQPADYADAIDLAVLGEISGDSVHVNSFADSSFIENNHIIEIPISDNDLLDTMDEDFSSSQLILVNDRNRFIEVPDFAISGPRFFVDDYGRNVLISNPVPTNIVIDSSPSPTYPALSINVFSDDYYLPIALLRRRRKRKRLVF